MPHSPRRWLKALTRAVGPTGESDAHCANYGVAVTTRTVYLIPNGAARVAALLAGDVALIADVPTADNAKLAKDPENHGSLGIAISDLGASSRMHEKDPATREKQLDEGRRFIDLAQALGVKYVRKKGKVLVGFRERSTPYLAELERCEVHMTHMPTPGDEAGLRKLGVNLTSDPDFSTKCLFGR